MAQALSPSPLVAAGTSSVYGSTTLRSIVSLRVQPCCASVRKLVVPKASLSTEESRIVKAVQEVFSDADNQKAAATTMAGSLFALLSNVGSAAAAQEVLSLADNDTRGLTLLVVLLPAIGWVLFNILRPALNQLDKMRGARSLAAAAGLGAAGSALFSAEQAEAAQEIAQLADDSRPLILLVVLLPAIGWVLFNILKPALNQLNKMQGKKGVMGAIGLGAAGSLLAVPQADAAQQIAEIADSRPLVLLVVLLPAIGWVLFNILKPALNQLNKMQGKKGVVGAVGMGAAASLLAAPQADAAQQIAQLADDSRPLALLVVLLPALGWVAFNILKPALNQLEKMNSAKGFVIGAGLTSAALLASPSAEAAQEIAQLADDSRPLILLVVLLPAIGWVLFNILKPALNQLNKMQGKK